MKTRFRKIQLAALALFFLVFSVSCAHDWNYRHYKPPGKAYAYSKVQKRQAERRIERLNSAHRRPPDDKYKYRDHRDDDRDYRRDYDRW